MIITLKKDAPKQEVEKLIKQFENQGLKVNLITGENYNVFGLVGDTAKIDERRIQANEWVANVQRIAAPYKLANRMFHPEDSIIEVDGIKIGGHEPIVVMAGPCSVEGKSMIEKLALEVKQAGAKMLRGGAYKPRTSPYAFQGMQTEGIKCLVNAKQKTGLPIVTELMSADKIDEFVENVDLIQIGARNMQNFELLKAVGKINKPILLKRGLSATIEEWIMSAEYIMANGNPNVILCERGIRTFEKYTRNTLDVSVIPIIKAKTHLPIVIDPSHATGNWKLVEAMSLAAIAAGADGLIIEVHDEPDCAWSDGAQSLKPEKFARLMEKAQAVAKAIGREI
ncbi:MAG: 3-deoxy-7-phosphoheptulonate synthase [Erysipelotrichaceae bacterium]|nr:3-deoxy-7-phosphoheptulonate synthase [Erysipelotrichaceae bacterium]MDY5252627.1 3-deoxy-7-phosphoheptulonate synthase [Erysipelotrichaceae bacterium]